MASVSTSSSTWSEHKPRVEEHRLCWPQGVRHFKTNAHRMRYAYFRDHGLFVGSGVVEAGCKSLVGQRLKLSGMRWNIPGATAILTLRCHQASDRFDHIWPQPHNQTAAYATA